MPSSGASRLLESLQTRTDRQVEDEQVESLRSYFDNDGIVELTELVALQNMSSKFNSALGVPAQGFCKGPIVLINVLARGRE